MGVVAFAGPLGGDGIMAEGCPDTRYLIGGDGHAIACAADQHSPGMGSRQHLLSHLKGNIRVIHMIRAVAAVIRDFQPFLLQIAAQFFF
ncbi:hypothetical protein D3C72_2067960 [compost metagenome]